MVVRRQEREKVLPRNQKRRRTKPRIRCAQYCFQRVSFKIKKYVTVSHTNNTKLDRLFLVHTLGWFYVGHVLIQRLRMDGPVVEFDLPSVAVQPAKGVLGPVLVVSFCVILTSVCSSAFLSCLSAVHG